LEGDELTMGYRSRRTEPKPARTPRSRSRNCRRRPERLSLASEGEKDIGDKQICLVKRY